MSLERFLATHLVIQSPSTPIYDAVRAMEDHGIGAVLVQEGAELAGIVTDRDIALKAVQDDLDPFDFRLCDVMSSPVASLPVTATVADVADLMLARRVRRVPILDGARIAGLVTLDDLLLERALDSFTLAALLRAQLYAPSRLEPRGMGSAAVQAKARAGEERSRSRHDARARQSYTLLLRRTLSRTGLVYIQQVEAALEVAVTALLRNVAPGEAGNLLAQLPARVREYAVESVAAGPDVTWSRDAIEEDLDRRLRLGRARAAQVLSGAAHALLADVSSGEIAALARQLPPDLADLLPPAAALGSMPAAS